MTKTIIAVEQTARGQIVHYSDGTRENIKKSSLDNTLLQAKIRGINKK